MREHYACPFDIYLYRAIWKLLKICLSLCWCIIALVTLPLTAIAVTSIHVFRYFVAKTAHHVQPKLGKMLSAPSSLLASSGVHTNPEETILLTFVIKGEPSTEKIYSFISNSLVHPKKDGVLLYPELQQYVSTHLGFYFWKWEDDFDVKDHVRIYNDQNNICDENEQENLYSNPSELVELRKKLLKASFQEKHSPWEFIVIKNFQTNNLQDEDDDDKNVKHTAIIFRIHHCMVDGYSLLKLIMQQFAGKSVQDIPMPTVPKVNKGEMVRKILAFCTVKTFQMMFCMEKILDLNDWHRIKMFSRKKREYHCVIVNPFPMAMLAMIKNNAKVSFTAVILAIVTSLVRKLMIRKQARIPKTIRLGFPYPRRGHPDKLRNHFTAGLIDLPVGTENPLERLKIIENAVIAIKEDMVTPIFLGAYFIILGGMFHWLLPQFSKHFLYTAGLTNFPGPRELIPFCGHEAVDADLCVAIPTGNIAVGVGAVSYAKKMHMTIQVDKSLILEEETHLLEQFVFEEIRTLTFSLSGSIESETIVEITHM